MRRNKLIAAVPQVACGRVMQKKWVVAVIALLSLASVPERADASSQGGTVTKVAFAGSRFLFWVNGGRSARPGCDCCNRWELSVSDPNSQARMSLILTAYAQGKSIAIAGTGACVSGANDTEGVDYFEVS